MRPLTRHEDRQRARHGLTDTRSSTAIGGPTQPVLVLGLPIATTAALAASRAGRPRHFHVRRAPSARSFAIGRTSLRPVASAAPLNRFPSFGAQPRRHGCRKRWSAPDLQCLDNWGALRLQQLASDARGRDCAEGGIRHGRGAVETGKCSGLQALRSRLEATPGQRGHLRLLQRGHQSRGDPCGSDLEARAARAEGGCGCVGPTCLMRPARAGSSSTGKLAGGQCHDRCLWACGSSSPQCEWLCSWICEGAPVVQGPQFVTR